jgi:hypothetical protein
MAKVKIVTIGNKGEYQWQIICPGCKWIHAMSPSIHKFNEDFEYPTFFPSLLQDNIPGKRCHSYIESGKIRFLSDCDHELEGQIIYLPEISINDF